MKSLSYLHPNPGIRKYLIDAVHSIGLGMFQHESKVKFGPTCPKQFHDFRYGIYQIRQLYQITGPGTTICTLREGLLGTL